MNKVTEDMRKAGSDIASDIADAHVFITMGGLGGSTSYEEWMQDYTGKNKDLIVAYLTDEIDSVTAIYLAMDREVVK